MAAGTLLNFGHSGHNLSPPSFSHALSLNNIHNLQKGWFHTHREDNFDLTIQVVTGSRKPPHLRLIVKEAPFWLGSEIWRCPRVLGAA